MEGKYARSFWGPCGKSSSLVDCSVAIVVGWLNGFVYRLFVYSLLGDCWHALVQSQGHACYNMSENIADASILK